MSLPAVSTRDSLVALDPEALELEVRSLRERLAFYEGFDLLIQDNVAHARELFRLAAQERESAAFAAGRTRSESRQREAALREELAAVAAELEHLAQTVDALSQRMARALGEAGPGWAAKQVVAIEQPVTIVVHGVPSARTALSLQRFLAALPNVSDVSAREFAGGVLRLDARVREHIRVDQLRDWDDDYYIQALTERTEVIEVALHAQDGIARFGA